MCSTLKHKTPYVRKACASVGFFSKKARFLYAFCTELALCHTRCSSLRLESLKAHFFKPRSPHSPAQLSQANTTQTEKYPF
ncbi:hypothetical protein Hanom_Chr12g01131421 [Helianthus anomalus]